jgi:hypothetical protein
MEHILFLLFKLMFLKQNNSMTVRNSVLDDIKTKQLLWYGHVQRVADHRWPKEVLKWIPLGRRIKRWLGVM